MAVAAWDTRWPPLRRLIACDPADMRRKAAASSAWCLAHDHSVQRLLTPDVASPASSTSGSWVGLKAMQREYTSICICWA